MLTTLVPTITDTLGVRSHSGRDFIGEDIHHAMQDGLGIRPSEDGTSLTFPKRVLKRQHKKHL